jgi:integrase
MKRLSFGTIYQRGSVWWLKYHSNGTVIRESARSPDRAEALRLLKKRQGDIVSGKFGGLGPERVKMSQLFDDLLEEHKRQERKSYPQTESRVRLHLKPAFGDIRAADLGSQRIHTYIARRRESKAANATINRELESLKRALVLGSRCDPPKVVRLTHVPMLAENNTRTGFLDDGGYLRLRNELPEYLRPLFVVAYHVGSRLGELRGLQWQQVDLAVKQIRLESGTTKNGRGRTLPIYGEMNGWLSMQKTITTAKFPKCLYVFQHEGKPIGEFRKTWASACKRAGVPGLLFHDLRRSAIRNMRLAGIAENVAMQISGHLTRSVFERYNIVSSRDLDEAATLMEKRLTKSLGTILGTIGTSEDKVGSNVNQQLASKRLQ